MERREYVGLHYYMYWCSRQRKKFCYIFVWSSKSIRIAISMRAWTRLGETNQHWDNNAALPSGRVSLRLDEAGELWREAWRPLTGPRVGIVMLMQ